MLLYYINLDFRKDRNNHILNELKKIRESTTVIRYNGIRLTDANYKKYEKYYINRLSKEYGFINDNGIILKKGIVGCYISHILVLNEILKNNVKDEYVIVVEDDIKILNNNILNIINLNINNIIPSDWDLIRLDTWHHYKTEDRIENNVYKCTLPTYINNKYYYHGTHFMIYRTTKIKKILNEINKQGICDYDALLCKCDLNHYILNEHLVGINHKFTSDRANH